MSGFLVPSEPDLFLAAMASPGLQQVTVAGRVLGPGSRVRLRPGAGGDIIDLALSGKIALVEGIDEDEKGEAHVAVILEDDPGRDLGQLRHPAHRFFFAPAELEPIDPEPVRRRVLVAGIGNVFFGDDGFGVAVANRLSGRSFVPGIEVVDFGIRGIDLAYALGAGYHAAILVDAVPRGGEPGSIYLIEPDPLPEQAPPLDSHRLDPLAVLGTARGLGPLPCQLLIVGCEPALAACGEESMSMELSPEVAAAVERAAEMVAELANRLAGEKGAEE